MKDTDSKNENLLKYKNSQKWKYIHIFFIHSFWVHFSFKKCLKSAHSITFFIPTVPFKKKNSTLIGVFVMHCTESKNYIFPKMKKNNYYSAEFCLSRPLKGIYKKNRYIGVLYELRPTFFVNLVLGLLIKSIWPWTK